MNDFFAGLQDCNKLSQVTGILIRTRFFKDADALSKREKNSRKNIKSPNWPTFFHYDEERRKRKRERREKRKKGRNCAAQLWLRKEKNEPQHFNIA